MVRPTAFGLTDPYSSKILYSILKNLHIKFFTFRETALDLCSLKILLRVLSFCFPWRCSWHYCCKVHMFFYFFGCQVIAVQKNRQCRHTHTHTHTLTDYIQYPRFAPTHSEVKNVLANKNQVNLKFITKLKNSTYNIWCTFALSIFCISYSHLIK